LVTVVAHLARYWPFANGSGRLIDLFAQNVDLGVEEKVARVSDGFDMHVLASDLIGRHLLLSGRFDRSVVQVLLDQSRPGDVLLDIGANIGYFSACFLTRVAGSKAICIEPQPGIVDLLRTNMAQFGARARIHAVALSDRSGELRFHVDPVNRGASRLSDLGEISVPAVRAEELLESVQQVDLIKIDVEGHERVAFNAMKESLARLRPRAILFEDQTGEAAPDGSIGSILVGLNYRIMGVRKGLFRTRLVPVRVRADCRFNDYVAISC
jgi:FkbM family methyltransferase